MNEDEHAHRIVIVGGGAGGLELATRLGNSLGRRGKAEITLVDAARTHIWKPLLHQLAAGSFDTHAEEIEYLAQARWNHFRFRLGRLESIDRQARLIHLSPSYDAHGAEITPPQQIPYDTLVIAIGSQTNDFGTRGAAQNAIKLDNPESARRFNDRLINACLRAQTVPVGAGQGRLTVTIVGAGATGVELAAELHATAKVLTSYGLEHVSPESELKIVLVEAAPRILAQLPERLSEAASRELRALGIEIHSNERVVEVTADAVHMQSGKVIPSTLTVWAAGIKAPDFLKEFGGLEVNRLNQLLVGPTLQTTLDPAIFAMGDCASCPQGDSTVPPRAQAAHQQANYLTRTIMRIIAGKTVKPFKFQDYGSLVSLASYSSVGSLMGSLSRGSLFVEGQVAKFMYWSLHKKHQLALSGVARTVLITASEWLDRVHRPRIKLH
ncbi:NAD(P)/FAD-dependent oxidoreductase [Parachitinimonas caeni]|uniref:NAD(P)/FAD-dependent oxidoreductase n=1 Tax=Parachitinimonas caeni TaxID=3031301 RepID=A0ABT7DYV0_9NEIS|nr:NAD(P)/FAD-dependent oxidoreductase [Parachitinimonas caeni]MDK2124330.1 NAD(P)/FAD-dependent oxidoreductase [Parachitinimonas caeni]